MATARKESIRVIDESTVGVTSVFARRGDHAVLEEGATKDEQNLGALGYKQEFKRCAGHSYFCSMAISANWMVETSRFGSLFLFRSPS